MAIRSFMLVIVLMLTAVYGRAGQPADSISIAHRQTSFSGTVKDAKGEPLVGASVFWKGTPDGAMTEGDGAFTLSSNDNSYVLVASYLGYENDTLDVSRLADGQMVGFVLQEADYDLREVTVTERRSGQTHLRDVTNGVLMNQEELFKAACCNLGESFTTNPSVDVNYSDAATGAKQIKLLGLSGTYVQMLTENIPNFRGAAMPYALGYVPGPWMESIQVSKGAASVKNGYESITGQIDVEYLKPDDEQGAAVNLYANSEARVEANVDANVHINKKLSTELLAHYEDNLVDWDMNNDGFLDNSDVQQVNLQNRWKWKGDKYIFHGGVGVIEEWRDGGQMKPADGADRFKIGVRTSRYEGYMKHAFVLNKQRGMSIALLANASLHKQDAGYGYKSYLVDDRNVYAQLMFETDFTKMHNLSAGLSINHDNLDQDYNPVNTAGSPLLSLNESETTPGAYVQYTLNLNERFVAMAGFRADYSTTHGIFYTPRVHLKCAPSDIVSFRFSAGKGYRTVHALAENNFLLASGRTLVVDDLKQESAWNFGASAHLNIPLLGRTLKLNAEYYYTHFGNQVLVDYDSDPAQIRITNLDGLSYSHAFQIDATYPVAEGLEVTLAYRLNDVKATYDGQLMEKPLTSRYKGLLTASYKTPLGKWQFDATLQLNGGGRMPQPYAKADGTDSWSRTFGAYEQVNAQITRWFRHFSFYIGAENITNVKQKHPILNADKPFSAEFEPTLVWGPISGIMGYAGVRVNIGRLE